MGDYSIHIPTHPYPRLAGASVETLGDMEVLTCSTLQYENNDVDEKSRNTEACLDFQNSHITVSTLESEPLCEYKEEESSVSASKWPEHDESLALWVKWRGKWQAGIKCERADWPLSTVIAKPTHDRKDYIVIFFPHTRNYSWADTLLACSIDEMPQPIAHRSHKVGVQLVEDLTVARRFIMKKLVIGMLNIVDQLPIQVLVETARDVVIWREFATEASLCKCYRDLGRLLLKLQSMLMQKYIDANWLQHSFHQWIEKCQNTLTAESIELLKEELEDSILWNEVNALRDAQEHPLLASEWNMWKHEAIKFISTSHPVSGGGETERPSKNGIGQQSTDCPLMTSPLQMSQKRPKLEVRRADPHNSQVDNKSSQDKTLVEIDSVFFAGRCTVITDNEVVGPSMVQLSNPSNAANRSDEVVVETNSLASKSKNRQCIAFIEAKGRKCVRWANDGDDYCCVHLASRFIKRTVNPDVPPLADAPMCQGTTTLGRKCKRRALPGSSFCKKHKPRDDGTNLFDSSGSQLKRKHDELLDKSEHTSCKDIVMVTQENSYNGGNNLLRMPENLTEESKSKPIDSPYCIGLHCLEGPTRHSLYCDKHIPSWLKRARNGKSRIISKEVFVDLLRSCSSQKQKVDLHQACELFYKFFKSVLSLRNQVPKEIQFQLALSEASKDIHVADLLVKLVAREKDRLRRIWGFDLNKDAQVSSLAEEQAVVPIEEESDYDGTLKCKICSQGFNDDQTLGAHWIDNHNKEAQWLFRGYACAICLDSFTNRKVLETHVQERHHAQFVEHCMLIQCIPCGSHFGNSEELWSHVLSTHTEGFRQSKTGEHCLSVSSLHKPIPPDPVSISTVRKYICKFCGLKFDLLPDLGRHHQAAHMGPSLLGSHPKRNGLRFYSYRLKSGRLSRPRFKKGLSGPSHRLGNKGRIALNERITVQSHVTRTTSLVRLTEAQCSTIAKMLYSEAQKTKARPNNHEILAIARSSCCKFSLQRSVEEKYGVFPERFYLKAAKLCSDHNTQVDWHQEGFNCSRGCKPPEDQCLVSVVSSSSSGCARFETPPSHPLQEEWDMDECHYVINSCHFRRKPLQMTIILCDDISFGQESVPVPCVVDKILLETLHIPTCGFDGQVIFMPWESFTYVIKPLLGRSLDVNMQNLQLGCGCVQSTCSPETCDHVYLFNNDHENAKDTDGKLMEGRFPYDDKGRLVLEDGCLVYECNQLCKCSKNCPNRVLQNGVKVKLEVFKTEMKGWAVRANEKISRGTFVCEFVGEVLDVQEANRRRERHSVENCNYFHNFGEHMQLISNFMEGEVKYVIDASRYGNVSRFINHSCSPNLGSHLVLVESMDFQLTHIGFYAKQDIGVGEEVTYDYGYELQPGEQVKGNKVTC